MIDGEEQSHDCGLVGGDEYRLHISRIILVGPGRPERLILVVLRSLQGAM
jgi:hypothetical protein